MESSILTTLATIAAALGGVFGLRQGYEQPRYTPMGNLGDGVELRLYQPRLAVLTDTGDGRNAAFGRLFAYISGANTDAQRLAMTVPVARAPGPGAVPAGAAPSGTAPAPAPPSADQDGRRIAMTVPVAMGAPAAPAGGDMRFFLPAKYTQATAPHPTDPRLRIELQPSRLEAVITFSGIAGPAAVAQAEGRLLARLAASGRKPAGQPVLYAYDPPFALPFLRRNEVAVPVEDAPAAPASATVAAPAAAPAAPALR